MALTLKDEWPLPHDQAIAKDQKAMQQILIAYKCTYHLSMLKIKKLKVKIKSISL